MPRVQFDDIEWDDNNRWYATKRGITTDEIEQVIWAARFWQRNKRGRSGDITTVGETWAGRLIRVIAVWDGHARLIRPINAWEEGR